MIQKSSSQVTDTKPKKQHKEQELVSTETVILKVLGS